MTTGGRGPRAATPATGCLYTDPVHLAPLVFMPIFMTLGNGLRFGVAMALYSATVATTFIGAAFALSPFWSALPSVSFGILVGTFVVPVYGVRLNTRLQRRRRALEARAAALEVEARTDSLTGLRTAWGCTTASNAPSTTPAGSTPSGRCCTSTWTASSR